MNWKTHFEEAKAESAQTHKPILLQFEMDNCGGCKKLYAETYSDGKVRAEMEKWFVLLKLDLIRDRDIRRLLSAYWTPSFYFLDHQGKPYFNFNGYVPAMELRVFLRLGFAETQIPVGKYARAMEVLDDDSDALQGSALFPRLLLQKGIAAYIRSKDRDAFMKTMAAIRETYPDSLEARMYFWD